MTSVVMSQDAGPWCHPFILLWQGWLKAPMWRWSSGAWLWCMMPQMPEGEERDGRCPIHNTMPALMMTCLFSLFGTLNQARKNTNPNFWVQISSGGVGVFHVKGWGPKKFGMSFETRETSNFSGRISRGFARISRRYPKNLRNKLSSIFGPYWNGLCLQTGIRITTTFTTCGWVRVSHQFCYCQFSFPERQSTNSITYVTAWSSPILKRFWYRWLA